jgi:hypothetical protein
MQMAEPQQPEEIQIPINLGNINEGAATEGFDIELSKVLANIADINTPATETRAITIKIAFKPSYDRCAIATEVKISSSLANIEKHESKIFMGQDDQGHLLSFADDPRQQVLFQRPKDEAPSVITFNTKK